MPHVPALAMSSFRDLSEVAEHLNGRELPFTWYAMGPEGQAIVFDVAARDCARAADYFAEHPLALGDMTPVPVLVRPRRGESWTLPPEKTVGGLVDEFDHQSLVGLNVDVAAARASGAGWFVRAHESQAMLTADFNSGRLNLCYGDDRAVESVYVG